MFLFLLKKGVVEIVLRHDQYEGKAINKSKFQTLTASHCRVFLKMMPSFGEGFQKFNLYYLAKVVNFSAGYLLELLDALAEHGLVSYENDEYFLTMDNIFKLEQSLALHPAVLLKKKIEEIGK